MISQSAQASDGKALYEPKPTLLPPQPTGPILPGIECREWNVHNIVPDHSDVPGPSRIGELFRAVEKVNAELGHPLAAKDDLKITQAAKRDKPLLSPTAIAERKIQALESLTGRKCTDAQKYMIQHAEFFRTGFVETTNTQAQVVSHCVPQTIEDMRDTVLAELVRTENLRHRDVQEWRCRVKRLEQLIQPSGSHEQSLERENNFERREQKRLEKNQLQVEMWKRRVELANAEVEANRERHSSDSNNNKTSGKNQCEKLGKTAHIQDAPNSNTVILLGELQGMKMCNENPAKSDSGAQLEHMKMKKTLEETKKINDMLTNENQIAVEEINRLTQRVKELELSKNLDNLNIQGNLQDSVDSCPDDSDFESVLYGNEDDPTYSYKRKLHMEIQALEQRKQEIERVYLDDTLTHNSKDSTNLPYNSPRNFIDTYWRMLKARSEPESMSDAMKLTDEEQQHCLFLAQFVVLRCQATEYIKHQQYKSAQQKLEWLLSKLDKYYHGIDSPFIKAGNNPEAVIINESNGREIERVGLEATLRYVEALLIFKTQSYDRASDLEKANLILKKLEPMVKYIHETDEAEAVWKQRIVILRTAIETVMSARQHDEHDQEFDDKENRASSSGAKCGCLFSAKPVVTCRAHLTTNDNCKVHVVYQACASCSTASQRHKSTSELVAGVALDRHPKSLDLGL